MEVEPRTAKQYTCHHYCSCKITGERGWRVKKKHHMSMRRFLAGQKIAISWGGGGGGGDKCVLGHSIA